MTAVRRTFLALVLAATPAVRADESPGAKGKERTDADRPTLQQLQADPARYARLVQELRAFQNLPTEQQSRLRKIDKELNEANPAAVARLHRSLVRYVDWLDKLPESKRNYIESATEPAERLARIRQLREQEWIERLPKAQQDQIRSVTGESRVALIKKFKVEEKQRRQDWQAATRHWDELQKGPPPTRRVELPSEARTFVDTVLLPRMTNADQERLKGVEGKWPAFMEMLTDLSDRYVPFPGAARPKEPSDLPEEMRKRIGALRPAQRQGLQAAEGKWPDYPQELLRVLRRRMLTPRLTPARPADFDEPVQQFIRNQLFPRLTADDTRQLSNAEGAWPDYPKAVALMAGKHNLIVPGMLPLPKSYLDKYRAKGDKKLSDSRESPPIPHR